MKLNHISSALTPRNSGQCLLTQWRLPVLRSRITLRLVDIVRHSQKLRVIKIVRKSLSLRSSPGSCSRLFAKLAFPLSFKHLSQPYLPSIAQRNQVVDVHITSRSPGRSIIRTDPGTACGGTRAALHNVCTIPLQDCLSCITLTRDRNPVREEIAGVAVLRSLSCYSQGGEFRLRGGGGWDAGWRWG